MLADFRARFPELSESSDSVVEQAIADARMIHNINKTATLFCAAHLVWEANETSSGRSITSEIQRESVGPTSADYVSMTTPGERQARFGVSSYGRQFLTLESRTAGFAISARFV